MFISFFFVVAQRKKKRTKEKRKAKELMSRQVPAFFYLILWDD